MRSEHNNIELVGATVSTDAAAIKAFREKSGADFPILLGVTEETRTAYGAKGYPYFAVLDGHGAVVGSDDAAIKKCVDG